MEASLNYREKLWIDRLDMCNSNMIKIYNAHGEFENTLNSIKGRQNELIRTNARMLEWMTTQFLGDKIAERPQPSISNFTASQDATNMSQLTSKPPDPNRRKRYEPNVSLFLSF